RTCHRVGGPYGIDRILRERAKALLGRVRGRLVERFGYPNARHKVVARVVAAWGHRDTDIALGTDIADLAHLVVVSVRGEASEGLSARQILVGNGRAVIAKIRIVAVFHQNGKSC